MKLTDIKQRKTAEGILTEFKKLLQKEVLKTKFCKVIRLKQK